jgi:hypothetical protein
VHALMSEMSLAACASKLPVIIGMLAQARSEPGAQTRHLSSFAGELSILILEGFC